MRNTHHRSKANRAIFGAIGILLLMALVFVPVMSSLSPFTIVARADTLEDKEKELDKAEDERKKLEDELKDLKKRKEKLKDLKNDLNAFITELDATLAAMEEEIESLETQITDKEAEIEVTQAELEEAKAREEQQYTDMMARMRIMYEQGTKQMITILLESTSIRDFLNRSDYIEKVVAYDRALWSDYQDTRKYVELCEQQLEAEKTLLDETKAAVTDQKAEMEALMEEKKAELEEYNRQIIASENSIEEYEKNIRERDAEIDALIKEIEDEKKRREDGGDTYDGGTFCLPLKSYTRISDDFGWRMHPTFHKEMFHNGVDFAAATGTPIYAAYDGTVVAAGYSASMGNYVMIDHGSGLYTIYMHASKLSTSTGTAVSKGDTIAAVGSTGRSTGPHLHFGVRLNGEYVSPWNYLKK
jgi:murein DD-endopeptidase MepM/ murein hydrolase activator NlpD